MKKNNKNAMKLFFRNKFVEFSNLLYDIISPIKSKKTLIILSYSFIGYWLLYGIGYVVCHTIVTPSPVVLHCIEYPCIGFMMLLMVIMILFIGCIFIFCILKIIKKIMLFITNNIHIAKKGIEVQSKWKKN